MVAEIIADDGVAIELAAVVQAHVTGKFLAAAERGYITFHVVMVGENFRLVAKQHE